MKKSLFLLPLIAVYAIVVLCGNAAGPAGTSGSDASMARGGAGCNNGSGCHGAANTSTTVTVTLDSSGYSVSHYIAGNTYNITIKGVNTSSASLRAFGFSVTSVLAAGAGTSTATNAGTLASSGLPSGCVNRTLSGLNLVEHNSPISPSSGSGGSGTTYSRSIPWTAPATGTGSVVLYGVLNAVNVDGSSSNDRWNSTSTTITELLPSVLPITGPTSVCQGNSITLSDASSGGTWSSSNISVATISATGVVTGLSAGTSIITYNAGTLGIDTALITVNAATSSGTVTGGTRICVGGSFRLTSTVSGGTWSSSRSSAVTVSSTGVVTGVTANDSAIIIYRVGGVCGTSFSYDTIKVVSGAVAGTIGGTTGFCENTTAQLYRLTGTGGGRWSTSTTSIATIDTNGRLYGILGGSAIVTYATSSSSPCGATSVVDTFTVLASPPAIGGAASACVGSTVTVTNAVPSGIWRGTNPSVAAVAAGFGTVFGIAPGVDTIIYVAPTGCFTKKVFYVYAAPGPITGVLSACPGATSVLSDTTAGGVWSSANPSIASVSTTGIVTGVSTNPTTISYTIPATGCNSTATFIVNPTPSFIQGKNAFCSNTPDSLFNLVGGGVWTSSSGSVMPIDSFRGVLSGVAGGTVSVTYTLPAGCFVTRNLIAHPAPIPTISIYWTTGTLLTQPYYATYQWYLNGTAIPGGNTSTVGAPYNGNYTVKVVDSFGCENTSAPFVHTRVGVEEVNNNASAAFHPNPATNEIVIDAALNSGAQVFGVDGRLMLDVRNVKSINISSLTPGIYILKLLDENGVDAGTFRFQKL